MIRKRNETGRDQHSSSAGGARMNAAHDMSAGLQQIVSLALAEDLDERGDITSQAIFAADRSGNAKIVTREPCTISGLAAASEVCRQVDEGLTWLPLVQDGQDVPRGAQIASLDGPVLSILAAERTALNFLARLSGIATLTRGFTAAVQQLPARIAATRKTDPGLRLLEKEAVVHGGGERHRLGLYDAVLIKDNHIVAAGGVTQAVAAVKRSLGEDIPIEVEADTTWQMLEAIEAGATQVLLDNMEPETVRDCVVAAGGRVVIEASGGITLANVRAYAEAGVDIISIGSLTHSARSIDMSLEMEI